MTDMTHWIPSGFDLDLMILFILKGRASDKEPSKREKFPSSG